MTIYADELARLIRAEAEENEATREDWETALDQVYSGKSTRIHLMIVETVHYGGDFDLAELEAAAGVTVDDEYEGDLQAFLDDLKDNINSNEFKTGWLERLESNSGNVQGQVWTTEVTR